VSIGDDVYSDRNRNGVRDDKERGIPNATVTVTGADGRTFTAVTDSQGKYTITCLTPGKYEVKVSGVDPLSKPTSPTTLGSFDLASSRLDADFGFDMSAVLGFEIDKPDVAPAIAFTGSSTNESLRTVSWLLSAGGALILFATRRRKKSVAA
jgi:SdrD B-like domain